MDVLKFQSVVDEGEFNCYQVLMSELDTTLDRMRCIVLSRLRDAYEISQFNEFWDYVANEEVVVVSVTDNSNLYELSDDSTLLVLSADLNDKMIIFDKQDKNKILSKMSKY